MSETGRNTRQEPGQEFYTRRRFVAFTVQGAAAIAAGSLVTGCVAYQAGVIMVVQSIQNLSHGIPLISGKRTIVRVFPVTIPGADPGTSINGSVEIFKGGFSFGMATPLNANVSSRLLAEINPDNPTHALDFEIPLRVIDGADISLRCSLSSGGSTPFTAPLVRTTLTFQAAARAEAPLQPVLITASGYTSTTPTMSDYQSMLDAVLSRLPVPATHYTVRPPQTWETNRAMTSGDDFSWLSLDLGLHNFNWFLAGANSDFPTGILAAPPTLPDSRTDAIYNPSGAGAVVAFSPTPLLVSSDEAETAFAHEFCHHYGLGHAAGCLMPSGVDPSLPTLTDLTGMDVYGHRVVPSATPELMSYCGTLRWPSSTTYTRVLAQVT